MEYRSLERNGGGEGDGMRYRSLEAKDWEEECSVSTYLTTVQTCLSREGRQEVWLLIKIKRGRSSLSFLDAMLRTLSHSHYLSSHICFFISVAKWIKARRQKEGNKSIVFKIS